MEQLLINTEVYGAYLGVAPACPSINNKWAKV